MNNRICELRKHLALTQTAFGDKIGLSRDAVAAYERGNAKPTAVALKCISTVFNVSLTWLETGEGEMFSGKSEDDIAIESALRNTSGSPALRAFLVAYSKLNDQNRAILEQFVADYVEEYRSAVVAENIKKDVAVFDNINPNPHFISVPHKGISINDGTIETKYAAHQEQHELDDDFDESPYPLPEDFSYNPFMRNPNDDINIIR